MTVTDFRNVLDKETLLKVFPPERANEFFEALFGDASEGSYDITLGFGDATENELTLELILTERPGCCLACNLTYGLPQVFSRHPIININGVVEDVDSLLGDSWNCGDWQLAATQQRTNSEHIIPLRVSLSQN